VCPYLKVLFLYLFEKQDEGTKTVEINISRTLVADLSNVNHVTRLSLNIVTAVILKKAIN